MLHKAAAKPIHGALGADARAGVVPAHAAPAAPHRRDLVGAVWNLERLARTSSVLTVREAFDFACAFIDDAVGAANIAVVHDASARPLVWTGRSTGSASLQRAASEVRTRHARLVSPARDGALAGAHAGGISGRAGGNPAPGGVHVLGTMRVVLDASPHGAELAFLAGAAVLLSVSLHRCLDAGLPDAPVA